MIRNTDSSVGNVYGCKLGGSNPPLVFCFVFLPSCCFVLRQGGTPMLGIRPALALTALPFGLRRASRCGQGQRGGKRKEQKKSRKTNISKKEVRKGTYLKRFDKESPRHLVAYLLNIAPFGDRHGRHPHTTSLLAPLEVRGSMSSSNHRDSHTPLRKALSPERTRRLLFRREGRQEGHDDTHVGKTMGPIPIFHRTSRRACRGSRRREQRHTARRSLHKNNRDGPASRTRRRSRAHLFSG
jgi:hypothetical protein